MKRILRIVVPILLIVSGVIFLIVGFYPVIEMKQGVQSSLQEWEEQKEELVSIPKEEIKDGTIIATLKIADFEKILPIRIGTTDLILSKGVGLDTTTPHVGEIGNSVLYGHREEIFWDLKDVKLGDTLQFETADKTLIYEITDIKIVDPDDPVIYEQTEQSKVTLVTCYPFIYMGDTPERYIVIGTLVE
ncbi:MAG TPA: class D sortase [Firmicutes bacterium]|nr:class D sortase [Bacillota bacterium]